MFQKLEELRDLHKLKIKQEEEAKCERLFSKIEHVRNRIPLNFVKILLWHSHGYKFDERQQSNESKKDDSGETRGTIRNLYRNDFKITENLSFGGMGLKLWTIFYG